MGGSVFLSSLEEAAGCSIWVRESRRTDERKFDNYKNGRLMLGVVLKKLKMWKGCDN